MFLGVCQVTGEQTLPAMKSAWPWDPKANGSSADHLKSPLEGQGVGAFCAMEFLAHGDVPLKLFVQVEES